MPTRTVLLLGRTPFDEGEVRAGLDPAFDVELLTGISLEDAEAAFSAHQIDTVIIGAGLPVDTRLAILRHVLTVSESTTVHLKDRTSGKEGMLAFVNGVLTGLTWHQWTWSGGDGTGDDAQGWGDAAVLTEKEKEGALRRMLQYVFGRSEPPEHPPPPPYSPGAGNG